MKVGAVVVDGGPVGYRKLVPGVRHQISKSDTLTSEYVRGCVVGSRDAVASITQLDGVVAGALGGLSSGDCKSSTLICQRSQETLTLGSEHGGQNNDDFGEHGNDGVRWKECDLEGASRVRGEGDENEERRDGQDYFNRYLSWFFPILVRGNIR